MREGNWIDRGKKKGNKPRTGKKEEKEREGRKESEEYKQKMWERKGWKERRRRS